MNNVYYTMNKVFLIFILSLTIFSCTSSSTEEKPVKVVEDEKEKEKEEAIAVSHGEFTDSRDGKTYKTITINGQIWMNENLNFEIPDSSFCYQGKEENCDKYGRTYPWKIAQHACPEGWSLPTRSDWETLLLVVEGKPKPERFDGLIDLGFNYEPAGLTNISWQEYGDAAYYWTSEEKDEKRGFNQIFRKARNKGSYVSFYEDKFSALSCRCVKDK